MRSKYRLGVLWQFIVWVKTVDGDDQWTQTGLWCQSMPEAIERVVGRPFQEFINDIREVEPWYWAVKTDSRFGCYSHYIIVRRDDCPDPHYMPLEPLDEPKPVDPSFKKLPSLQL